MCVGLVICWISERLSKELIKLFVGLSGLLIWKLKSPTIIVFSIGIDDTSWWK